MKVIGAGFGRTGTTSLKAALERIGFGPSYHMFEVMEHPEHVQLWLKAHEGELADWDELLGGYESTMDWPGCTFWPELTAAYPDAKVILNYRDPERWYDSVANTFLRMRDEAGPDGFQEMGPPGEMSRMVQSIVLDTFDDRMDDREHALEVFRQHYANVQANVPADRLLVYEVKQGWDPLCEFLGVDVPDEEFPHLNDSASFAEMAGERFQRLAE